MNRALSISAVMVLVPGGLVFAGNNAGVGKIAVHLEAHASRSCAKAATTPVISGCADIVATHAGFNVDAFPVMFDLVEYQGFDYGLNWVSPYSAVFTSCSPLTIGGIVNPGDGVSHAWYTCQPGPVVIPGFAWLYSYGLVCLVAHPEAGGPNIGDCAGALDLPVGNYCGGTNGEPGEDPCAPTAIEPSTWGAIKSMFK
jgi:hypothetical protein